MDLPLFLTHFKFLFLSVDYIKCSSDAAENSAKQSTLVMLSPLIKICIISIPLFFDVDVFEFDIAAVVYDNRRHGHLS